MVDVGGGIDADANATALAIAAAIRGDPAPGWGDPVPAFDSVLVPFDPDRIDAATAARHLERLVARLPDRARTGLAGRLHRIVVHYGGAGGPDLERAADRLGLSPAQLVEAHAAPTYRVFMLGFAPGFGYLGPLPEAIRLPRRDHPRARVPAGSIAIAGAQTAIYPGSTPGGWHLIGRTDTVVWDARRAEPALLMPGDSVRFEPAVR